MGDSASPEVAHLFDVLEDFPPPAEAEVTDFQNCVAKLLLPSKHARPNIHTMFAFLATQVREPREYDQKNSRECSPI